MRVAVPARSDNEAGRRVAALAGECEGVLTVAELRACGMSPESVRTRVRHGTLHRVHLGVYAVGHANLSPLAECVAAVKACGPHALLGLSSALASVDLMRWDEALPPEAVVVGTTAVARPGIRVHRTLYMPPQDVRELGCIRVTSPARTIADMAARLGEDEVLQLVRTAQGKRRVTHRQLLSLHDRLGRRPGCGRLISAIARGPEPTRSVLESVVLNLILSADFERPLVNQPLRIAGRQIVPDFLWPCAKLVLEADGRAWHSGLAAQEADAERQAILEAHGFTVLRVTWHEAVGDPGRTLKRLARAGAPLAHSLSTRVA